jgi:BirA family transcriptional regulator, biotin operon repressor / biotin---[acetyl-CoA-carboxylase] ligase
LGLNDLRTKVIGKRIVYLQETTSTNDEAMRLIPNEKSEGTVVFALSQTKGRGRLGRRWISPPGNIYLSIILKPYVNKPRVPIITLMSAVACARTLKGLTRLPVSVKWPNDIMVYGKKIGGILCEMAKDTIVVGIGINLNSSLSLLPVSLKKMATSVKFELGSQLETDRVVKILLEEFDKIYLDFLHKKDRDIISEWTSFCHMLGSSIEVDTSKGKIEGIAKGLGSRGELIVKGADGKIRKIYSADAIKVKMEMI